MSELKRKIKKSLNYYSRAKKLIPGGGHLLSKRPDRFLEGIWPGYFSSASGCKITDVDNNEYIDMSIMGIGTNSLGYSHPEVDQVVKNCLELGNMSSFNCTEEIDLAEKLISIHGWSDMVRFARTGGEANAVAIRIARAASGRDKVAVCGYHGWHDWYLAVNVIDKSGLDQHLIKGLDPQGVPKNLKNTIYPFHMNNTEEFNALIQKHDIGVVKMEVERNVKPDLKFLKHVRKICDQKSIVLIFDECTSGFRQTNGGLHKHYGINPDMAVFGKALGNGYAITAILGKKEIMEVAEATFISSTFWTERIGPTAALKTLELMEQIESWKKISKTGVKIKKIWRDIANSNGLAIDIGGLDAIPYFKFQSKKHTLYRAFIIQEMLKKGFLAADLIFVCTEHKDDIINQYADELFLIFKKIREFEDGKDIEKHLESISTKKKFSRLN